MSFATFVDVNTVVGSKMNAVVLPIRGAALAMKEAFEEGLLSKVTIVHRDTLSIVSAENDGIRFYFIVGRGESEGIKYFAQHMEEFGAPETFRVFAVHWYAFLNQSITGKEGDSIVFDCLDIQAPAFNNKLKMGTKR